MQPVSKSLEIFSNQSPVVFYLVLLILLVLLMFLLFLRRKKPAKKTPIIAAIEAATKKEKKLVHKKTELEKDMGALQELREHRLISRLQFYKKAAKLKRQHG